MKQPVKKIEIKEAASGAFFVKHGDDVLGGFHDKSHADIFFEAIGKTGLYPSAEETLDRTLKLIKPKFMVKIYINGFPFNVEKNIKAVKLCELVYTPIENAEISTEDGSIVSIDSELELNGNEHFQVYRLRVSGS